MEQGGRQTSPVVEWRSRCGRLPVCPQRHAALPAKGVWVGVCKMCEMCVERRK